MVHKLRKAMGKRDARYTLESIIDMDESYFAIESGKVERTNSKRGLRATGNHDAMAMSESIPLDASLTGENSKQVPCFKAKVLAGHTSGEVDKSSIVFTDKSTSYVDIADYVELHVTEKSYKETCEETLKWVHILIGKTEMNLLGNCHKIKRKYLQAYLDEFAYKLNQRYCEEGIFDKIVKRASKECDTLRIFENHINVNNIFILFSNLIFEKTN